MDSHPAAGLPTARGGRRRLLPTLARLPTRLPTRLPALALAALAALACLPGCAPPDAPRPSVLLMVVDTLRADHLGTYGYPRDTSPNLDALAARGVVFEDVVSQSSWTLPSMIALMTGRFVFTSLPTLPPARQTLAELLQGAGYHTAAFVGNDVVGREEGFPRGFDHFVVGAELLEGLEVSADTVHDDSGRILVDRVLTWAEQHLEEPYFLYVHFIDPHLPYLTPPEYADFEDDHDPLYPAVRRRYRATVSDQTGLAPNLPDELAKIRRTIREYDAEVAYVDARIGDLLHGLDDQGRMGDTLVAFTADHGEVLYERVDDLPDEDPADGSDTSLTSIYRLGHGEQLYDELIHVPLIISGPGLLRDHRVPDTVASVDLLPTLLGLVGVAYDGERDGRDLGALLSDPEAEAPRRQALYSYCEQMTSVINPERRLKLLRHNRGPGEPGEQRQLFDLARDPAESHDLLPSASEHHADAARFLEQLLIRRELKAQDDLAGAGYLESTQRKMRALGYIK